METVRNNADDFVRDCVLQIKTNQPKLAETRIEAEVRKLIFFLVEFTGFGFIKRISYSVGHPDLEKTYVELAAKGNSTNARKLLEIAVRLDSLEFPEELIFDSAKEFSKNTFSTDLLKRLVVDHFYLFPKPYRLKQRVCAKLGIPVEKIQAYEALGSMDKRLPRTENQGS